MATNVVKRSRPAHSAQKLRQTKIPTLMFETSAEADKHVSLVVESLIRENNSAGLPTVLGLPTGSTPIGVYRELIRLHREEDLDFSQVITFNLDEYYPMDPQSIHSYRRWMKETFFDHVNIPEENINIPKGDIPREEVDAFCDDYERRIERAGGIDIQLLGIGRSGHIGFNEPGSSRDSLTRLVALDPVTRGDAADSFFGEENVPMEAITMGVGSILSARKIMIMALGEHKAPVVKKAVEGEITDEVSASFLQKHPQAVFIVDKAAAGELTAVKTPWMVGAIDWTPELTKRAVIGLSEQTGKPLLKLNRDDFMEHHLHGLLRQNGEPEALCMQIFDEFMEGICTHPAGKDKKTVIVFSPHPDDDVISMGGTLITMADQGHDVYIAYMTSGNIAVFDHDALRHIDFVEEYEAIFGLATDESRAFHTQCRDDIASKQPGDPDTDAILNIKGLIRKTEAITTTAAIAAGVPEEKLRFLDMPFYQTGKVSKRPIGEADVHIVADLLADVKPDQIYVAGDLSDPHGTHRTCARAILAALDEVRDTANPEVWLYRGAWQEYEPHEIDRVVPLSFDLMQRKKLAIFRHESQKDAARFPGSDKREFWLRAEQRTQRTAEVYNNLGLPEFYGLEGFARWRGQL